jgi:tetratricopeptide (TPR) repeat protein
MPMRKASPFCLFVILTLLVCGTALAASAQITMTVVDDTGKPIKDTLIMFAMVDDPTQSFTISENEVGAYASAVQLPRKDTAWRISRVVATGYLPMQISIDSKAGGQVVQEVTEMELNPGIPIPEIEIIGGGTVEIGLTLGERSVVMAQFAKAREAAKAAEPEPEAEPQTDTAYADALRLYGDGDVDGSIPYFKEAIAANPEDAEMRVTYANVLFKAQHFDEFEEAARDVIEVDPDNGEMMMMLYSSARGRGDMKTALEALLAVKEAGLAGADLLQHLDFVAKKMGQSPEAIPAYLAILDMDSDNVDACRTLAVLYANAGDTQRSGEYLAKAVELAPGDAFAIYLEMGTRLLGSKNPVASEIERGIQLVRKAIDLDPSIAPAYKTLGLALWKQEDWTGTRQALQKYLELSPEAPDRDQILDYLSRLPE